METKINSSESKPENCILCKKSNFGIIHRKSRWTYLRCRDCGLVSLFPKPSSDEYKTSYDEYLPEEAMEIEKWAKTMEPVIARSVSLINTGFKDGPGKILDVGSGYGFFLKAMQLDGWETEGVEISETGRNYAVDKLGLKIYESPLEKLDLPENSYHVVTLFYVIEHVPDPLELVKKIKRIIKPGGMLLLRWPHTTPIVKMIGSLSKNFDLYHTPYHLYDFSPRTIKRLLASCGFLDVETMIGGYTLPSGNAARLASIMSGKLGELLFSISGGMILLPGLSKTTIAVKDGRSS
ncbi:class I SAM-dependent methyltransferase [Thermodesulfobacteriota bacterium]